MSDWLDLELAHRLARESAPEELWKRVLSGARPVQRRNWPVAAVLIIAAATCILWLATSGQQISHIPAMASDRPSPPATQGPQRESSEAPAALSLQDDP